MVRHSLSAVLQLWSLSGFTYHKNQTVPSELLSGNKKEKIYVYVEMVQLHSVFTSGRKNSIILHLIIRSQSAVQALVIIESRLL